MHDVKIRISNQFQFLIYPRHILILILKFDGRMCLSTPFQPRIHSEQDLTYYFCAWMIIACVFTLSCEDMKSLGGSELWDVSGDVMSLILICMNLLIVVQIAWSSDLKRRRVEAKQLRMVFDQMVAAEAKDREAMDGKWKEYVVDARPGSEEILYEKMALLVQQTKAGGMVVVAQKQQGLPTVKHLMKLSKKHNKKVHSKFLQLASQCGAEYHEGPLKDVKRVQEKAKNDYKNDFRKVVDIVRGTIEFEGRQRSSLHLFAHDSLFSPLWPLPHSSAIRSPPCNRNRRTHQGSYYPP